MANRTRHTIKYKLISSDI